MNVRLEAFSFQFGLQKSKRQTRAYDVCERHVDEMDQRYGLG